MEKANSPADAPTAGWDAEFRTYTCSDRISLCPKRAQIYTAEHAYRLGSVRDSFPWTRSGPLRCARGNGILYHPKNATS